MSSRDVRSWKLPFRIGTTSYIVPDDLLSNAAFLAPFVQDMQLVLFEVPGGPSNLPSLANVAALAALGRRCDLTYTVHLLHDLRAHDQEWKPSLALAKAQEVLRAQDLFKDAHASVIPMRSMLMVRACLPW